MPLKISRILHAGYIFEFGGMQIAFDPIFENPFSRNCYAFPEVRFDQAQVRALKLDAVFISHFHDDHCSLESLHLLDRGTPIYLYCVHDELFEWIRELGFREVQPLRLDAPVKIGEFEVIPRRALDEEVDSMFQIRAGGLNILNVVDSWIDPSTLERLALEEAPWDMILWPFQTLRELEVLSPMRHRNVPTEIPTEWIDQLQRLKPRFLVASSCQFIHESWSWYNHALFPISYARFREEMAAVLTASSVMRLNPGMAIFLDPSGVSVAPALSWVEPVGDPGADYEYKNDFVIPTTAEVARNFSALLEEQEKRVDEYCRIDLLQKYHSLGAPEHPFFKKPRLWQLSLYGPAGEVQRHRYWLKEGGIEFATGDGGILHWLTEVPVAKLHAAIESGESLTSMYVRVNDIRFDSETEAEMSDVELIDDPLIRCLFNGAFGAYQRAQFEKLKAVAPDSF